MDSLLSIVQMPAGIPVGTLAIGRAGAVNAALLAAAILALHDDGVPRSARCATAPSRRAAVLDHPDPRRVSGRHERVGVLGRRPARPHARPGRLPARASRSASSTRRRGARVGRSRRADRRATTTTWTCSRALARRPRRRHLRVRERAGRGRPVPRRRCVPVYPPPRRSRWPGPARREEAVRRRSGIAGPAVRAPSIRSPDSTTAVAAARPARGAQDAPARLRRQGPGRAPRPAARRGRVARARRRAADPGGVRRLRPRAVASSPCAAATARPRFYPLVENHHARRHPAPVARAGAGRLDAGLQRRPRRRSRARCWTSWTTSACWRSSSSR